MDVRNFLQFKRSLKSHGIHVTASDIKEIIRPRVFGGNALNYLLLRQSRLGQFVQAH